MSKVMPHIDALDGLRTLAVGVVMAFHFGLPVYGGTIGVDSFFVLSGFLITTVMLRDFERHGRVRFLWFWTRRIKRLVPGMLLVVVTVVILASLFSPTYMKPAIASDATSTLFYYANWHFIQTTSYFMGDGSVSPLLHMWSLAVEEQFYIFWPIIFWCLVRVKFMKDLRNRILVFSTALIAFSASELFVLWFSVSPDRAYMGTDSRSFQIAVGAALACLIGKENFTLKSKKIREALMLTSLAGLLVLAFTLGNSNGLKDAYPKGGALLVAILAGVAILGVTSGSSSTSRLLAIRPMSYLGRLSYGMYLWHWPLYIFCSKEISEKFPNSTVLANFVILFPLTVIISAISYQFVEHPIRFGDIGIWMTEKKTLLMFFVSASLISVGSSQVLAQVPTEKTLVLIGDSVPDRMTEQFDEALKTEGWTAVSAAYGNCPALAFAIVDPQGSLWGPGNDCQKTVMSAQTKALETYNPSAIMFWSRYEISDRYSQNGKHLVAGTKEFWLFQEEQLHARLDVLQADGAEIFLVQIEPIGLGIKDNPQCTAEDCHWFIERLIGKSGQELIRTWNQILIKVATERKNVHVIDIKNDICLDDAVPCNDTKLTTELSRYDGSHFTPEASEVLAPVIVSRIFDLLKSE
jgi:peptidoglycan/LPS O-acetylase OafA/YrhL